ncbi:MAG: hypoxanthine phosphoribosyltransferase [Deltaproteobacteria bacterium]|nr:hypoxanthine phosphoribosyltransferase [Deltaproteobacteria bacterium]
MIPERSRVEVMLSAETIQDRVAELGAQISRDYAGRDLTLIGILKGSVPFLSDLMRHITVPVQIDFLEVSSYGGAMESSGIVRLVKDLSHPIHGKDVLIVEDIVDTGLTLTYLIELLTAQDPASTGIASLLDKPSGRTEGADLDVDYVGFTIPNAFVVGYGLDLGGYFRNLPFVGIYTPPEE